MKRIIALNHHSYKNRQLINMAASPKLIRTRPWWFAMAIVVVAASMAVTVAFALTPANGGFVGGTTIAVDNTPGDQSEPSVSGDLATYTDISSGRIGFYDFLNPANSGQIPAGALGDIDTLSDVSGTRIVFSRQRMFSRTCMVFDRATSSTTEIAPGSGITAWQTALGGDTVAFVDAPSGNNGDIMVGNVLSPTAPLVNLSASADPDFSPAVSPSGTGVVWERCNPTFTNCGILKSTFSVGSWSPAEVVADTISQETNPDTDGVHVVYDSDRATSDGGADIYYQPLAGGVETQLSINGTQRNPSISQGVITFETVSNNSAFDLFVYVIATNTLWQVTSTASVNELLSDVSVLPNGDVRVIWAADDDIAGANNLYARTFTLPRAAAQEKIAFVSDRESDGIAEIYIMNSDGSSQTRLTNNLDIDITPSFSPDGSKIVFMSDRDAFNRDIYVMNSDGSNVLRLTNDPAFDLFPTFSPDGSKIAFTSDRDGNSEIYVMNSDGSNQIRLTSNPDTDADPAFSPDGSKIVFDSQRDGDSEIYVMNADGSGQTPLTDNTDYDGYSEFSPDGSKILFFSLRDGNFEIYVMNADGSNQVRLTNNSVSDADPAFSSDGSKIAFTSERDGNFEIYVMNSDGSSPTRLTNDPLFDLQPSWGGSGIPTADTDGDGIVDAQDNCPFTPNPNQENNDGDAQGDACDPDDDNDGQTDADEIACGSNPLSAASRAPDNDLDNVPDCVDPDDDNDGVVDTNDNCQFAPNTNQVNTDGDSLGNVCDPDDDNDGIADGSDNCPLNANANQADNDNDGQGNVCDADDDNDGVPDTADNCPLVSNPNQADADNDGIGDACDPTPTPTPTPGSIQYVFSGRESTSYRSRIFGMRADGALVMLGNHPIFSNWDPALSPDRTKIAFTRGQSPFTDIYVMNADGSNVRRLTTNAFFNTDPSWSPDGTQIAFTSFRFATLTNITNSEILVMNADGTNVRRITKNPAEDSQPAWSPNGQRIAFASDRHGNHEIYQVNANGTGPVIRMTQHPAADLSPDWSPDGTRIAFMTLRDGNREIYSIDSNGSAVTLVRLTNHPRDDIQPAWGPNGKILFSAIRTNDWQIYMMNADGSGVTQLTNRCCQNFGPHW